MASKRLTSVVRSVAPCHVESSDVSYCTQFHLLAEEEDGKLGDWSPADEITLRLEVFQFLRNLEAHAIEGVFSPEVGRKGGLGLPLRMQ